MGLRGGEVVSYEAHNLETWVQFPAPQPAGVAQWLERGLHKAKVAGSIPAIGTNKDFERRACS